MPAPLRLHLLGSFQASDAGGAALSVTGRKIQALLAFLAIERRREHKREELATLLWGETLQERSRHNLRQALSKIRQIGPDLLVTQGDTVVLDPAVATVDVLDFERLIASDDPAVIQHGLELYRGDLLAGLVTLEPGFDDWLRGTRTRLREKACKATDRLAELLERQGYVDESMEVLLRRLTMDTACEAAHRNVMRLLHASGRRSDALRQYEQCVDALDREFGVVPGAETMALLDTIRDSSSDGLTPVRSQTTEPDTAELGRRFGRVAPPSVAVLPFDNLSGDEDRYFADGFCEDLITALSRFSTLFVIARPSSFRFRDQDMGPEEIGTALQADYLVRGSIQRSGKRLRLNVQLLDASTGHHRWAQRFDAELEDVMVVQDEVTETVVSTLAGRVEADGMARARRIPPERLDAYDYVLRGKDYHHRFTPADCKRAIQMFQRAIQCDDEYGLPHAWLACCYGQEMNFRPEETMSLMEQAHVEAERAGQLDEHESECHRILAQVFIIRGDLPRSQSHQERALFLNANDDRSVCAMGEILNLRGRPQEAERWVRKAMRLNPYHPDSYRFHLARSLFHCGRSKDAGEELAKITQPRTRELVYAVAASGAAGAPDSSGKTAQDQARRSLHAQCPQLDVEAFVKSLPYEHEAERTRLRDALQVAGLPI